MKPTRYSAEIILDALEEHAGGQPAKTLCFRLGVSQATFFRWKRLYGRGSREEGERAHRTRRERFLMLRRRRDLRRRIRMLEGLLGALGPGEPGARGRRSVRDRG